MKFTASRSELQTGVNTAIRAVPSHSTIAILTCILIKADADGLTLMANDMEMGIETHVKASVEEPGVLAVEAKMFSEIIRKLPDEVVRVDSDDHEVVSIRSGKARFSISGNSGEEFTELPVPEMEEAIRISQYTLKSLILNTIFCVAANENSKIMTGEFFEVRGDIMRVVALDGHRIAIRRAVLHDNYPDRRAIVPGKTLLDISRILTGEMDEIVKIFLSKNHILFEINETRVVSRLIDGEYFHVDQMISNDYETKITVNRIQLQSCLDRATLFVKEGDKKPIILEIEDGEIKISIDSPLGNMEESFEIGQEGKNMVIGLNPRFMLDALKAISDENINMYLTNPKAPCFLKDEEITYTYLVLPVNFMR